MRRRYLLSTLLAFSLLSGCDVPTTAKKTGPNAKAPEPGGALGAKPRAIVGTATYPDGRPIPSFTVTTEGGGMDISKPAEGKDGRYELTDMDPSMVIVYNVNATAPVTLNGQHYDFPLDPTDGLPSYPATDGFKGDLTQGVVRNFVFKLTGVKPDSRANNPKETDDTERTNGSFYGGDVAVTLAQVPAADLQLQMTLTPSGPLVDGSAGTTITRTYTVPKGTNPASVYLHDIPLGSYTLSITVNGAPAQLTMREYGTPLTVDTPSASIPITWTPSEHAGMAYPTVTVQ